MEGLGAVLPDRAAARAAGDRDQVAVRLAEGVAHLVEYRLQGLVAVVAEPHRKRVEGIAELAWQAQQPDRPAVERQAHGRQMRIDPGPQGAAVARAVVAVPDAEQARGVVAETAQARAERRQFVQVEEAVEHRVGEAMAERPQALVYHPADVETRPPGRGAFVPARAGRVRLALSPLRPHAAAILSGGGRAKSAAGLVGSMSPLQGAGAPRAAATVRPACRASSWKPSPQ